MTDKTSKPRRGRWAAILLTLGLALGGAVGVASTVASPAPADASFGSGITNTGRSGHLFVKLDNGAVRSIAPGYTESNSVNTIIVGPYTCVQYWKQGSGGYRFLQTVRAKGTAIYAGTSFGVQGAWRC